ncbi:hypothetical protein KCP69_21440 [Salmonella enterica subsp. enterica]|nr:hypothetical protein KCP69_21440 [Salmonella enterica subsp. enterica]
MFDPMRLYRRPSTTPLHPQLCANPALAAWSRRSSCVLTIAAMKKPSGHLLSACGGSGSSEYLE